MTSVRCKKWSVALEYGQRLCSNTLAPSSKEVRDVRGSEPGCYVHRPRGSLNKWKGLHSGLSR